VICAGLFGDTCIIAFCFVLQVQMRFCLLETSCEQDDCFPPGICVKVNGKMCPLPVSNTGIIKEKIWMTQCLLLFCIHVEICYMFQLICAKPAHFKQWRVYHWWFTDGWLVVCEGIWEFF
jgi:hypothetical protein